MNYDLCHETMVRKLLLIQKNLSLDKFKKSNHLIYFTIQVYIGQLRHKDPEKSTNQNSDKDQFFSLLKLTIFRIIVYE
jgi:hypothetical protein